jgi:esterase/lipase
MHATVDLRVPYGCMKVIQDGIGTSASVQAITLEDCYHVITVDREKQTVFEKVAEHIRANL